MRYDTTLRSLFAVYLLMTALSSLLPPARQCAPLAGVIPGKNMMFFLFLLQVTMFSFLLRNKFHSLRFFSIEGSCSALLSNASALNYSQLGIYRLSTAW